MSVLELSHVSKSFHHQAVLDDISLSIEPGEFVCILGQSGSGKTTLLRLIAGFETLDKGTITLGDKMLSSETSHMPAEKRGIGVVFQDHALWPHMTVFDNVAFPLTLKKQSSSEISQKVRAVLSDVSLQGMEDRLPHQLSGGEAQRVSLARTLVQSPAIIVFDEPLASLDAVLRQELQVVIKQLHREKNLTCLYITHDQAEAMRMSHRIAVIEKGSIVQCDTPMRLYHTPKNEYIAKLIGQGGSLPATMIAVENELASIRIGESIPITVRCEDGIVPHRGKVFCRPEDIALCLFHEGQVVGTVLDSFFMSGNYVLDINVTVQGDSFTLKAYSTTPHPVGTEIGLKLMNGWILPQ